MLLTDLTGCSLATSLLAGLAFKDISDICKAMRMASKMKPFFERKRNQIIGGVTVCVCLDVVNSCGVAFWIAGVEMIVGSLLTLFQLVIGVFFVKSTVGLIKLTSNTISGSKNASNIDSKQEKLRHMAKWLGCSGILIVTVVCCMPLIIFSGGMIYGIYAPKGWASIWAVIHFARECFFSNTPSSFPFSHTYNYHFLPQGLEQAIHRFEWFVCNLFSFFSIIYLFTSKKHRLWLRRGVANSRRTKKRNQTVQRIIWWEAVLKAVRQGCRQRCQPLDPRQRSAQTRQTHLLGVQARVWGVPPPVPKMASQVHQEHHHLIFIYLLDPLIKHRRDFRVKENP